MRDVSPLVSLVSLYGYFFKTVLLVLALARFRVILSLSHVVHFHAQPGSGSDHSAENAKPPSPSPYAPTRPPHQR